MKQYVRNWLGIKEAESKTDIDLSSYVTLSDFKKLEGEMFKHRQLLKKRAIVKCLICSKSVYLWPLETEAYYTKDGEAYHVPCYRASKNPNQ